MINFRNSKAVGFAVIILGTSIAALSLPALAGGHGGGGGGRMGGGGGGGGGHMDGGGGMRVGHPPGHPPPPLILDSGAAGRAVSSNCFKPVVDAHGTVVAYRRIRACN